MAAFVSAYRACSTSGLTVSKMRRSEFVGITVQYFTILTCPGLSLIGIDDKVATPVAPGQVMAKRVALTRQTLGLFASLACS